MKDIETISERDLARRMGVSVEQLRKVRHEKLDPAAGDFRHEGNTIMYSKIGAKKAGFVPAEEGSENSPEKKEGAGPEGAEAPPEDQAAALPLSEREDVKVTKYVQNPKVIMGTLANGSLVSVRVRKPRDIALGTVLPNCRRLGLVLFAYEGRLPRFKGGKIS